MKIKRGFWTREGPSKAAGGVGPRWCQMVNTPPVDKLTAAAFLSIAQIPFSHGLPGIFAVMARCRSGSVLYLLSSCSRQRLVLLR